MSCYIVPNHVRDAIYKRIDDAIVKVPDAAPDREHFYAALLDHFAATGIIPDFDLVPNTTVRESVTP